MCYNVTGQALIDNYHDLIGPLIQSDEFSRIKVLDVVTNRMGTINKDPNSKRRALTAKEIHDLLEVTTDWRQLLYEVALCTGLRVLELRSLTLNHLDVENCGLRLEAGWTKNRKPGFQPLPERLVQHLLEFAKTGFISKRYLRYCRRTMPPDNARLYVPSHPAREMDKDLEAAGIPKETNDGKLDFHALRTGYIILAFEAGANSKEAQTLARHCSAHLTENIYARTRDERLSEMGESARARKIGNPDTCEGL